MQNDEIRGKNERTTGLYIDIHEDCERIFNEVVRVLRKSYANY